MFCGSCGKELEEGTKFCDSCGAKVELENIQAEAENEDVARTAEAEAAAPLKAAGPAAKEEAKKPAEPVKPVPGPQKIKVVSSTKPLGIFTYLWMFILMVIPVVDLVMILVWALGKNKNVNKKNFSWAAIIFILLGVICWLLVGVIFAQECKDIYMPIWNSIRDFLKF